MRRGFVGAGLSLAGGALLGAAPARAGHVRPGMPGWPSAAAWAGLKEAVGGRLAPVVMPDLADPAVRNLLGDPFYIGDQPALTQSSGWLDAWRCSPSTYVVVAESAADVAAAVRFARAHRVRLVVKGGGHSYFGASNAPDSLLIWTRRMNAITVHDALTPRGSRAAAVPAVSAGAGCIWLHLYQAVTGRDGRYVQGGGCSTVGVPGLVQGGGFGSFSKAFGTAAGGLLEAAIVTADGQVRTVSEAREPDLFWALKGGGGGTFGVVTRMTLATHALPATFGAVNLMLHARSDAAYRRLLGRFVAFYAESLCNPHWGEQVSARPDNRLRIAMVFQGLTQDQAQTVWKKLLDFVDANRADYQGQDTLVAEALPARDFWDASFFRSYAPGIVRFDRRPGASPTDFWWAGDAGQVGAFWYGFSSAWMPASLLKPEGQSRFVDAWFAASRHAAVTLHVNKGLAGAPAAAIAAARNTGMNPDVLDAFALAIIADAGPPAYPGLPPPNRAAGEASRARMRAAMGALRAAAPAAGAYVNECDFFQPDWQRAFWGGNYQRLARIKRHYDPGGLFTVHHGVGSEA